MYIEEFDANPVVDAVPGSKDVAVVCSDDEFDRVERKLKEKGYELVEPTASIFDVVVGVSLDNGDIESLRRGESLDISKGDLSLTITYKPTNLDWLEQTANEGASK